MSQNGNIHIGYGILSHPSISDDLISQAAEVLGIERVEELLDEFQLQTGVALDHEVIVEVDTIDDLDYDDEDLIEGEEEDEGVEDEGCESDEHVEEYCVCDQLNQFIGTYDAEFKAILSHTANLIDAYDEQIDICISCDFEDEDEDAGDGEPEGDAPEAPEATE